MHRVISKVSQKKKRKKKGKTKVFLVVQEDKPWYHEKVAHFHFDDQVPVIEIVFLLVG